jgi:hypothetical protein
VVTYQLAASHVEPIGHVSFANLDSVAEFHRGDDVGVIVDSSQRLSLTPLDVDRLEVVLRASSGRYTEAAPWRERLLPQGHDHFSRNSV